ncbi:conjugal transfer protein [Saccharolobus islandicus]|uniref:Conserved conjugative plasmid protein n=1 Tax=Saccharolobus islandicus (strain M.16.4 / Kamchatka \|nr:conjugal transfer protein [Sulfolobus islandicus]ACR41247.1 conserved conjugative plasmid protein [Sulfolobus islandicus M.16.4]
MNMLIMSVNNNSKYILGILKIAKELNIQVTATRIQKTVFLVEKELKLDLGYNFIPFYFGPFSKELQDDIYKLSELGYVKIREEPVEDLISGVIVGFKKIYEINVTFDLSSLDKNFVDFVTEKLKMPLNSLLKYVYMKYPEYTVNSLIKDKIF